MASGSMQRDIVVKSVTSRLVKAKGIEKSFQLSRHKNIAGDHIDLFDILVVNRLPAIAQRPLDVNRSHLGFGTFSGMTHCHTTVLRRKPLAIAHKIRPCN